MNKELLNNYRLLSVSYGNDTGLVSLVTGDLLSCAPDGCLSAPSDVPCFTITDGQAEQLFGEEHNWNDLIDYLQATYDWERKVLP